jgi:hypothetical protein
MNTATVPEEKVAHFLIDAATWAPSVHNTQPWWFGTRGPRDTTVTVHADPDRRLDVADPDGREMMISCGAALLTLLLAVRRLGRRPDVRLLPDPERPGLVADVTAGPPDQPPTEDEFRMYLQIRRRRTHRGGFRPEGLPAGLLHALRTQAMEEDVSLRVIADPRSRIALGGLTEVAEQLLRQSPDYCVEMARWAPRPGSVRRDGVHEDAYPRDTGRTDPHYAARDFARGHGWGVADDERDGATGVVTVLTTRTDGRADWVRAGQGLQRVLLRAAENDVSAAFHTQALELPDLREVIRRRFCDGAYPQTVMRLGMTDREMRSVRRPAEEVTRPEP